MAADNKVKDRLLDTIKSKAEEAGYEVIILLSNGIRIYRLLLDGLGASQDGLAVLELNFLDDTDMGLEADEGILQFFVTFDVELDKSRLTQILAALNKINMVTTFGAFQLYTDEWQLYYRYTQLVKLDEAGVPAEAMKVMNWIMAFVDDTYDNIKELAGGRF